MLPCIYIYYSTNGNTDAKLVNGTTCLKGDQIEEWMSLLWVFRELDVMKRMYGYTKCIWVWHRVYIIIITVVVLKFQVDFNSYSASHDNWCTVTLYNRILTAQCEGMWEVGSAIYEPALLPPCPSIRALSYSNCQRSTHSSSRAWQCKC